MSDKPWSELTNAEKLFRVRHSSAHIMAQAVLEVFPDAKLAIGPPIANGFYYDFDLPRPVSTEDLADLEERMRAIVKKNAPFTRTEKSRDEALAVLRGEEQPYKVELVDDLDGDTFSFYTQDTFTDLCRGPHVMRTGQCKHFKLQKVAGAYWRGDEKRPMLQRIYGTAFLTKEALDGYLTMLEEAEKRDHRRLGRQLDLYSFHQVAPGAPFWHPKGWTVFRELRKLWRELHDAAGYVEICNPIIYDKSLYETSGHWDHYREHMFTIDVEGKTMCVKPMNCPDTMLYYKTSKHSYRELPLRVSEGQVLHRNELSGALNGLLRVRHMTQDDAHIFTPESLIGQEIKGILKLVDQVYGLFHMEPTLYLSTRPDDFMGEIEVWNNAEAALKQALTEFGRPFRIKEGDGAFYGPKIDLDVTDSLGRSWQLATVQLDFQLPARFELTYTDADNTQKMPVVIHRAIFGTIERFIGVLVEHLAGVFPTWLAPVQAILLPINDDCLPFCDDVAASFRAAGIRVEVDRRSQKIGYKIREAELRKVPHMLVVGVKEVEAGEVSLRTYRKGPEGNHTPDAVRELIQRKIATRELDVDISEISWSDGEDDGADPGASAESMAY
jgi:threonyl-tRNA synthetase